MIGTDHKKPVSPYKKQTKTIVTKWRNFGNREGDGPEQKILISSYVIDVENLCDGVAMHVHCLTVISYLDQVHLQRTWNTGEFSVTLGRSSPVHGQKNKQR